MKAVAFAALDLAWLGQFLSELRLPSGSDVLVVDRSGTILARYPDHEQWVGKPAPQGRLMEAVIEESEGSVEAPGVDWIVRVHRFTAIGHMLPEQQISLSVGIPRSVLLAGANRLLIRNLAFLVTAVLLFIGVAIVSGRFLLLQPIGALIRTSQKVAVGDEKARTGLDHRRDEFGELGRAFDSMAEALQDRDHQQKTVEADLRESEQLYQSVADLIAAAVVRFDSDGRRTFVNDAFIRRHGGTREELLKHDFGALLLPEERAWAREAFDECVSTGQPKAGLMFKALAHGNTIHARGNLAPLLGVDGRVTSVQLSTVDVTELVETQEEIRQSEQLYREVVKGAKVGVAIFDLQGRRVFINDILCVRLGVSEKEALEGNVGDLTMPEDAERVRQLFRRCATEGVPITGGIARYVKDGQTYYVMGNLSPIFGTEGQLVNVLSTSVDITEMVETQEALLYSEELYRSLVDSLQAGVVRVDRERRRTFVNQWAASFAGRSIEALMAGRLGDTISDSALLQETEQVVDRVFNTGEPSQGRMRYRTTNWEPVRDALGNVVEVQATSFDITDLMEAQERLRKSDAFHRGVVALADVAVARFDVEGRRVLADEALAKRLGASVEELKKGVAFDHCPPEDREELWRLFRQCIETGKAFTGIMARVPRDGKMRYLRNNLAPVFALDGNVSGAEMTSVDVTELVEAQEQLQRSEEMYRSLVDSTGGWVMRVDREGRRTFFSGSAARILGRTADELRTGRFGDTLVPEDAERVWALLRETFNMGNPVRNFLTRQRVGDETRYIMSNWEPIKNVEGHVVEVQTNSFDVTEQIRLQQQFAQAQKMESVGRLAGGVAHDFNNMLTAILGYSEMALGALPERSPARGYLREVQDAGKRAANLTRQLLAFSRRQVIEPRTVNPNELVEDVQNMLHRLIGEDIEFAAVLAPDAGHVRADPGQLEQVLINLAVNSRDAMPRGGKLTIETANVTLDEEYERTHEEVSAGEYVLISVTDTGAGMSDDVKMHLFEPFFTTKAQGLGTGLGLATCYGIVKQAGGHIEVESELGRGTTMKVFLPRILDAAKEKPGTAAEAQPLGGAETVLVVEDEVTVRNLTTRSLRARGYTVLAAANGVDALRVAQEHSGPIHLLFTDVVMPEMDGKQLAERLKALHPEARVLFTSGYTDEAISHRGVLEPGVAFLQKPFLSAALLRKIRDVLDQPPSDTKED
ncbi:MAG: PAS domain S-box protein [Chloroflexota bacterium]|nr:PAS domain S-box protein [Chloroflexota bacterium]